jgi:hypothetical protein
MKLQLKREALKKLKPEANESAADDRSSGDESRDSRDRTGQPSISFTWTVMGHQLVLIRSRSIQGVLIRFARLGVVKRMVLDAKAIEKEGVMVGG